MTLVPIGQVGKPFGVRGTCYVRMDPDLEVDHAEVTEVTTDRGETLRVAEWRPHGERLLVRFEGVDDRDGAEALRGRVLSVDRALVADDDLVWFDDLRGRDVVDREGCVVGTVEALLDGLAHDYLVLARPDGGEALVPIVDAFVDLSGDPLRLLDVPEGLLD